jgi:protease-4
MTHANSRSLRARVVTLATSSAAALVCIGCGPTSYKITPVPADQTLEESVLIDEGWGAAKIATIDVSGVLLNTRRSSLLGEGENPVSLLVEQLSKASEDNSVRAVVLRINSPGGTVTASELMHSEVLRVRKNAKNPKPVVAVIMDVGASGAYYTACACDRIVACRTSVVGSIGVIMQLFNFRGTLDKIGAEAVAIKSGKMKDAGSPFRKMTDEEQKLFQDMVGSFYDRFVTVVAAGRPELSEPRVREIADGRVWTAEQALKLGLIDEVGTLREALAATKEMIKAKRVRVVTYHRPLDWKPNIYASSPAGNTVNNYGLNISLAEDMLPPSPMFLYLWAPGL